MSMRWVWLLGPLCVGCTDESGISDVSAKGEGDSDASVAKNDDDDDDDDEQGQSTMPEEPDDDPPSPGESPQELPIEPSTDPGGQCPEGYVNCDSVCIDVAQHPDHCGGCDRACGEDQNCTSGTCSGCPQGAVECDGACFDVQADTTNCGGCGIRCGEGQVCSSGECTCLDPLVACDSECVDLVASNEHCGACGAACTADEVCDQGECSADGCSESRSLCDGSCVDLQTDARNCGACNIQCPVGQQCSAGACSCPAGETDCTGQCSSGPCGEGGTSGNDGSGGMGSGGTTSDGNAGQGGAGFPDEQSVVTSDASGWVAPGTNPWGIGGGWYLYDDGFTQNFSSSFQGTRTCVSGTTALQLDPTLQWGAGFGLVLSDGGANVQNPWDGSAYSGLAFELQLSGVSDVTIQLQMVDTDPPHELTNVSNGPVDAKWSSFAQPSWATTTTAFDPSRIGKLQIRILASPNTSLPFNVCINNIRVVP